MELARMKLEYVVAWPNHAGMFVARKKGFYAENGLDVDIVWNGWDRGTPAELAIAGEYQFVPIRLGELLETRKTDNPFVAVATFNQVQLGGVISTKSAGVSCFKDLEGKTLAMSGIPRMVEMVREAVEKEGGDFSKVTIRSTAPYVPDIRGVESGECDAVFNVLGWESYTGTRPFNDVVQLNFDDLGIAPHHAYFLCVTEKFLAERPDMVRNFVAATSRGYDYALANEEEALDIMLPTMCDSSPHTLRASFDYMKNSWHAPSGRWGEINPALVESYTQWMIDVGATTASMDDIPGSWTNEYLPEK